MLTPRLLITGCGFATIFVACMNLLVIIADSAAIFNLMFSILFLVIADKRHISIYLDGLRCNVVNYFSFLLDLCIDNNQT